MLFDNHHVKSIRNLRIDSYWWVSILFCSNNSNGFNIHTGASIFNKKKKNYQEMIIAENYKYEIKRRTKTIPIECSSTYHFSRDASLIFSVIIQNQTLAELLLLEKSEWCLSNLNLIFINNVVKICIPKMFINSKCYKQLFFTF